MKLIYNSVYTMVRHGGTDKVQKYVDKHTTDNAWRSVWRSACRMVEISIQENLWLSLLHSVDVT